MPDVVICGGGVAGTYLANSLVGRSGITSVTLVEPKDYLELTNGVVHAMHNQTMDGICIEGERAWKTEVNIFQARLKKVLDKDSKVELDNGSTLPYDILILATGAKASANSPWRPAPEIATFIDRCRQIDAYLDKIRKTEGDILILGCGATGVELITTLSEQFPDKVFHMALEKDQPLPRHPSHLRQSALANMKKRKNVRVHQYCGHAKPNAEGEYKLGRRGEDVEFKPGMVFQCFSEGLNTTGLLPEEWLVAETSDEVGNAGEVIVDEFLRCAPNVYAVGDIVAMGGAEKSAKLALAQAEKVAPNVWAQLNDKPLKAPYTKAQAKEVAQTVSLGHKEAIASVAGSLMKLTGGGLMAGSGSENAEKVRQYYFKKVQDACLKKAGVSIQDDSPDSRSSSKSMSKSRSPSMSNGSFRRSLRSLSFKRPPSDSDYSRNSMSGGGEAAADDEE